MIRTRTPDDNNEDNAAYVHPGYRCPDYADSVRSNPYMDPIAEQVLAAWGMFGRTAVPRLDVAKRFGWNCRFAGDVLFYLRERDQVASTGRGGAWVRVSEEQRTAIRAKARAAICPTCSMTLPLTGLCDSCT